MAATNWMPDCRRVPTGAYGGYGSIEADTVVCHSIEGCVQLWMSGRAKKK